MTATQTPNIRRTAAASPWLPAQAQLRHAAQLQLAPAIGTDPTDPNRPTDSATTTMQQAMGLVMLSALIAGLAPTLFDWWRATQAGTAIPLLDLAQQSSRGTLSTLPAPLQPVGETLQIIAGLEPIMPGWLAALLSAIAEWINWPLTWLSYWLGFGIIALVIAKLSGAPTTLQRFYAGTGYAAIPLILVGLGFIPWIGWFFALAGTGLALIAYWRAVRTVTGLSSGASALCVAAPLALGLIAVVVVTGATIASVVRMMLL